jgi:hypothetical protein
LVMKKILMMNLVISMISIIMNINKIVETEIT